jgi:HTH-type transcriptional regulator, competence development regulator
VATLGETVARARKVKKWTLAETAKRAGFSVAYLHKLENDDIQTPSPHQLQKVAQALKLPYTDLMRLAGYVVSRAQGDPSVNALATALKTDLKEDEVIALSEYLGLYRSQRRRIADSK